VDKRNITIWILKIALAGLYLMMAMPKFQGADLTIFIFSSLGVEPWGRYATGSIEIAVFLLVLIPATTIYGVLLSLGTIIGALLSHIFVLGFVVENASGSINDGGEIFMTALIILALTVINLYLHRKSIPFMKS